jgi:two-component system, chemotaxis family, chemotaxis protein CheY
MKIILIVDDSPTIRRIVHAAFSEAPITVIEAASGLEAIEQLSLKPVALMILDLNMPDMHGLEVLKFVRQHPTLAHLPIVILTTRGDDSSRRAAQASGATMYVTKPFEPRVLREQALALLAGSAAETRSRHVES